MYCLIYKDGCSDDNDGCFDYKVNCFYDKEAWCQHNKCCIDDNEVNIDWLNAIVALQWSLFRKQGVLYCDNDSKLVNNAPDCYNKMHCFKNNDCYCCCNKLCLHYKKDFLITKTEIVMS